MHSILKGHFNGNLEFKNFTQNFGVLNRNFGFSYRNFGFLNRDFGFSNLNFGIFKPFFEPKLRFSYPKLPVFENRSFVFLNQSCSFCKEIFFVLPKLRLLIPGFFVTETSEYQIHTKFLTKFRLSRSRLNRRNSRSFG
jgi:hypothetical protein